MIMYCTIINHKFIKDRLILFNPFWYNSYECAPFSSYVLDVCGEEIYSFDHVNSVKLIYHIYPCRHQGTTT